MHAIRTFVAIDIPSPARKVIAAVQRRFLPLDLKATWVRPENVHLTLKFLGNINPDRVPEVANTLASAASSSQPFTLSLDEPGLFSENGAPRVLWLGLKDGEGRLGKLYRDIDKALHGIGFGAETRPFAPHITVAKIKSLKNIQALKEEVESGKTIEKVSFEVTQIVFIESQLSPEGSQYTELRELPLGSSSKDKK